MHRILSSLLRTLQSPREEPELPPGIYTDRQIAYLIGIEPETLARDRQLGPAYIETPSGQVRYLDEDVSLWTKKHAKVFPRSIEVTRANADVICPSNCGTSYPSDETREFPLNLQCPNCGTRFRIELVGKRDLKKWS